MRDCLLLMVRVMVYEVDLSGENCSIIMLKLGQGEPFPLLVRSNCDHS